MERKQNYKFLLPTTAVNILQTSKSTQPNNCSMDKSYEQHLYFGDTHLGSILGHQLSRSEVYCYEFLLSPLVNSEIDQILLFVSGLVPDSKTKPE